MSKDILLKITKELEINGFNATIVKFYKTVTLFRYGAWLFALMGSLFFIDLLLLNYKILPLWFGLHYIPEVCLAYLLGMTLIKITVGIKSAILMLIFIVGGNNIIVYIANPTIFWFTMLFTFIMVVGFTVTVIKERKIDKRR